MSRCNSPIPDTMVSLLSGSCHTRKVGSSLVNLPRPLKKLSASFLVAGVIDIEMTGSGTKIDSFGKQQKENPVMSFQGLLSNPRSKSIGLLLDSIFHNFRKRPLTIDSFWFPFRINVSPLAHSTPNSAAMSPACTSLTS